MITTFDAILNWIWLVPVVSLVLLVAVAVLVIVRIRRGTLDELQGRYVVHFDGNGADSGTMRDELMAFREPKHLTRNRFHRDGYRFVGWNTSFIRDNLLPEAESPDTLQPRGSTSTEEGRWKKTGRVSDVSEIVRLSDPPTEKIRYGLHLSGGAGNGIQLSNLRLRSGRTYTLSCYVSGTGALRLQVWGKNDRISRQRTSAISKEWNRLSMTFVADGELMERGRTKLLLCTMRATSDLVLCGVKLEEGPLPTAFVPEERENGVQFRDWEKVSDLASEDGETITLYAIWEPKEYKVRFDGNGSHAPNIPEQTVLHGETVRLNNNTYDREGYIFRNWNTRRDGTGDSYENQMAVSDLTDRGNVTLYAQWEPIYNGSTFRAKKILRMSPALRSRQVRSSQGACVAKKDGKLYCGVCFINNTQKYLMGNDRVYHSSVVLYDVESGRRIAHINDLPLDHANGMCYDEDKERFYVVTLGLNNRPGEVFEFDWDLAVTNRFVIEGAEHIGNIACWDHHYYGILPVGRGRYTFVKVSPDMTLTWQSSLVEGFDANFCSQGLEVDGNYIYDIAVDFLDNTWTRHQRMNIYEMDGTLVGMQPIPIAHEVEDLSIVDGDIYMMTNRQNASDLYLLEPKSGPDRRQQRSRLKNKIKQ